jgi:hypothetical protein
MRFLWNIERQEMTAFKRDSVNASVVESRKEQAYTVPMCMYPPLLCQCACIHRYSVNVLQCPVGLTSDS